MMPLELVEKGREAASVPSVFLWGLFGWAFALVALLVVYLRSPAVPASLAATLDLGEGIEYFEKSYIEHLKARQVKAVWIGVICAVVTSFPLFLIALFA